MKVVAIDQGTTGTKAFSLDCEGQFSKVAGFEHAQHYPRPGWVEHDVRELLSHVQQCLSAAGKVDAIGIDNQGETLVAWDSRTGEPCYNAIVWQDDRTKDVTARLKAEGAEDLTQQRAGLPLDPYFSASKMKWIIDHVPEAARLLREKRLRIATSEAYFLDRLTGVYATDVTTASRTSLMSLDTLQWDEDLLALFGVPQEVLPDIRDTTGPFGDVNGVPVTASLVDQQAALFGHGCMESGDAKITFGTGAFALAIAGADRPARNAAGLAATVAWRRTASPVTYALDGAVYNAASAVNWARSIGLFSHYDEIGSFAGPSALARGLVFVPALSGLACPHWDRTAAGLWIGLGLDTSKADMMQALLEGVALRAAEVIDAMATLLPLRTTVSIDGGLANNPYFSQVLSNALNREVTVAASTELTGLGAARMAMLGAGARQLPPLPRPARVYSPLEPLSAAARSRFAAAVQRASGWHS
ncbi:MAG: FGGY family carbohydrate kinase [Hyphomicrobiales bacterium]